MWAQNGRRLHDLYQCGMLLHLTAHRVFAAQLCLSTKRLIIALYVPWRVVTASYCPHPFRNAIFQPRKRGCARIFLRCERSRRPVTAHCSPHSFLNANSQPRKRGCGRIFLGCEHPRELKDDSVLGSQLWLGPGIYEIPLSPSSTQRHHTVGRRKVDEPIRCRLTCVRRQRTPQLIRF